ncbi:hypothetical protein EIP86_001488 [Pleurotus ostreatoroseus]|nr:hypothetical protein EIP86_001488 [Pleurotus ostreatoroseus]
MELDDFQGISGGDVSLRSEAAKDAVEFLDAIWYSDTNRRGRWMDLMGDYAGTELFVIDGDSLLQLVLDDPLLALGRPDDPSFQILHAKYSLEKILSDFLTRNAAFEIVFWHSHRHSTQATGSHQFIVSSRTLARHILAKHLDMLPISVHYFDSLDDPRWRQYTLMRRPMFIMLNDGGVLEEMAGPGVFESLLLQRLSLFDLITQGFPIALLRGVEFRDSKILTFIFEQNLDRKIQLRLQGRFRKVVDATVRSLERQESIARGVFTPASVSGFFKVEAENAADARIAMVRFVRVAVLGLKNEPIVALTLLHAFVAHMIILPMLPIEARARKTPAVHPKLAEYLRKIFLPAVFFALENAQCGGQVDLDSRIFMELLQFTARTNGIQAISSSICAEIVSLWTAARCSSPDYTALAAHFPLLEDKEPDSDSEDSATDIVSLGVLPFENPVFDEVFSSLPLRVADDQLSTDENRHVPYMDISHWHNHRRAILPRYQGGRNSGDLRLTEWQRKRQLRSEQRFMAKMQWQAASLAGASGKALQRITIVSGQGRASTRAKPQIANTTSDHKAKAKGKKVQMSKADIIRQQHAEKKREDQDASNVLWWNEQLQQMDTLETPKVAAQAERLLNNARAENGWLAVELRLFRIHLQFLLWTENPLSGGKDMMKAGKLRDRFSVAIVRMVKELYEYGGLFPKAFTILALTLQTLGFEEYIPSLQSSSPNPSSEDRRLSFKFLKLFRSKSNAPVYKFMHITEDPIEWQLRLFGEFMDRSMDGLPDSRVSFIPDAWQRKVLDCLDANHSLLVVAPTSAGKTFISYYAMEQVLRESDQGVLIYVAPTKALVSQIAAEVYARFNKDFKTSGNLSYGSRNAGDHAAVPAASEALGTENQAFFYVLGEEAYAEYRGLEDYEDTKRLRFLHPVSLLGYTRLLPPDFSLEASDCLSLFHALEDVVSDNRVPVEVDIASLHPSKSLGRNTFLQQKDIIAYETRLKDVLAKLVSVSDPQVKESPLSLVISHLQDPMVIKNSQIRPSPMNVLSGLIHLASDLYVKGDLPALFFLFDRSGCEIAAQHLLAALQTAEEQWRGSSLAWKQKIQQWNRWKAQAASRRREEEQLLKANKKAAEDPQFAKEASWEASFDPDDPNPQFSFLGSKASKEHLEAAITDLSWTSTPPWVMDALRRGIGTLALGINAPTKTSVFCADSPFLTALMYRQCAGRAGRRGFDLLGKVVFYGLPLERAQRLVLSRLPSLGGSFPLTATMVLRLFNLLQGSGGAPKAVSAIRSILNLPQVSFVHGTGKQEIMHHVRFSIDYLRRLAFMDREGNPINLFGLATHLYYTEPSNFAMTILLREGVIHDICLEAPNTEDAKRNLLLLLCHLFGRRYVPKVYTSGQSIKALLDKSPSKVILPPISAQAKAVLIRHDQRTLNVFTSYALTYVTQHREELGPDHALPLSNISFSGSNDSDSFIKHLQATASSVAARSCFVANSGRNDSFGSVDELVSTVRSGIHLKEHGIPSLQHLYQDNGSSPLNAYLFDFYVHGQVEALVRANGIRRGEIWYLLQDFMLTLKTIRSSVEQLFMSAASDADSPDEDVLVDPAEMDGDEDKNRHSLERPRGVAERDWRVCEVLHQLTEDFDEKFRAMWA